MQGIFQEVFDIHYFSFAPLKSVDETLVGTVLRKWKLYSELLCFFVLA